MRPLTIAVAVAFVITAAPVQAQQEGVNPQMVLDTSEGVIIIELFQDKAPLSVANVIQYAEEGFYDGTIFHRVINRFMIQGGGFGQDMVKKEVRDPIPNEADNGLSNVRGTVALARTSDPHSATAQFFISTVKNDNLDHRDKSEGRWGYCVFGRVVEGMSIVDRISRTRTRVFRGFKDVPMLPIVIERASIRYPDAPTADG